MTSLTIAPALQITLTINDQIRAERDAIAEYTPGHSHIRETATAILAAIDSGSDSVTVPAYTVIEVAAEVTDNYDVDCSALQAEVIRAAGERGWTWEDLCHASEAVGLVAWSDPAHIDDITMDDVHTVRVASKRDSYGEPIADEDGLATFEIVARSGEVVDTIRRAHGSRSYVPGWHVSTHVALRDRRA